MLLIACVVIVYTSMKFAGNTPDLHARDIKIAISAITYYVVFRTPVFDALQIRGMYP